MHLWSPAQQTTAKSKSNDANDAMYFLAVECKY